MNLFIDEFEQSLHKLHLGWIILLNAHNIAVAKLFIFLQLLLQARRTEPHEFERRVLGGRLAFIAQQTLQEAGTAAIAHRQDDMPPRSQMII